MLHLIFKSFFVLLASLTIAWSQNKNPTFQSQDDSTLTIKKIYIENFSDNVNQIYAPKAQERISNFILQDQQWEIIPDPKQADATLASRLTKNPKSYTLRMTFTIGDKKPILIQDTKEIENIFETEKILSHYELMFQNLKHQIPYHGMLLSRASNKVTLNIGSKHGLKSNQDVIAIHIVKANLHPKLNTLISTDKIVLGKIKIDKVDDFLSFGTISFERDPNILQKGTKLEFSAVDIASTPTPSETLNNPIISGNEGKQEWVPKPAPQFGRFSITGGLLQYTQNIGFVSENKTVSQWLTPTIKGFAELWLDPSFHIELFTRQSSFKLSNPLGDSTPGSLNINLSQYQIKAKFNFELDSTPRSPQFQLALGIGSFQALPDTSTPISLSSLTYGGTLIGFKGQFPISDESPIDLGIYFNYFFSKTLKDSASATPSGIQINDFGMILRYMKSLNLAYVFELSFESYGSDFDILTGQRTTPVSSISHRIMGTLAGVEYSF